MAGGQNGGVVVAAHELKGNKVREAIHHDHLRQHNDHQRQRQTGQLPEFQRHQRLRQEDGQEDVAQRLNFGKADLFGCTVFKEVAHAGCHEHRADISRYSQTGQCNGLGDIATDAHCNGNLEKCGGEMTAVQKDLLFLGSRFVGGCHAGRIDLKVAFAD
ncbi:hypothetical protein DSECCO2_628870 [anaerobic digester metagenome]